MRLTKTMRFSVRVREFENVSLEVGADASHFDLGVDDKQLALMTKPERERVHRQLRQMVEAEVRTLSATELETVSRWADYVPNLADDYLETIRSTNADNEKTYPPSSIRRIRRRAATAD